VFDANGNEIGPLVHGTGGVRNDGLFWVYLESIGATVRMSQSGELDLLDGDIFFSELDCQGQAYLPRGSAAMVTWSWGPGGCCSRYFVGRREPSIDPDYQSRLVHTCLNEPGSALTDAVPADEVLLDDFGLTFPLPGPLHIAPGTP
jgi:hypothetical protein